jgi:hypothetical protein
MRLTKKNDFGWTDYFSAVQGIWERVIAAMKRRLRVELNRNDF